MEIHSTYNSGILTVAISGSINAAEAANLQTEMQKAIDDCDEVSELVIDATDLSFISSMGLRVLLSLRKEHENMRVIGVSPEVFNVFKITGFHKIITVEKALENISVEGLSKVEGMDDVYAVTDETLLKVYPEGTTKEDVDHEVAIAKEIFVMGIPAAMAFDIVKVGNKFGLIYESTTPKDFEAKQLGNFLRDMHEMIINPEKTSLKSCHDAYKAQAACLGPVIGEKGVDKLLQMLNTVPDGSAVLHGNLNLNCIMMQNGEPILTDLAKVGFGSPILDLAHLYSTLTEEQRGQFFEDFTFAYFDLESAETIAKTRERIAILSIAFDFLSQAKDAIKNAEKIQTDFKERIEDHWDEILSKLHFKMDFAEEVRKLERKMFYLDSDVDIDWVASRLSTNRHYVSDYFNKVLHTTFNDYINNLRLDYAVHLMEEGRIPLSQIVFSAGFNNDHTFRRIFKDKFGCTPSQYKK